MDQKTNNISNLSLIKILLVSSLIFASLFTRVYASGLSVINATVRLAICGNNVKESGEQCDGTDLGGKSCTMLGFDSGSLSCSFSCEFDTSSCVTSANVAVKTTFSPGADRTYILPDAPQSYNIFLPQNFYGSDVTSFLFSHNASDVSTIKPSPSDENFFGKVLNLLFVNENGDIVHTLSKTTTITLSYAGVDLGEINEDTLAPYRSEDGYSNWIAIPGYTLDKSNRTISFQTSDFSMFAIFGSYRTGSSSYGTDGGGTLNISDLLNNLHYPKVTLEEKKKIVKIADFNNDGVVNLADLSILLYYMDKPGPIDPKYDLNSDGKLDLADVSIMLYYWDVTR